MWATMVRAVCPFWGARMTRHKSPVDLPSQAMLSGASDQPGAPGTPFCPFDAPWHVPHGSAVAPWPYGPRTTSMMWGRRSSPCRGKPVDVWQFMQRGLVNVGIICAKRPSEGGAVLIGGRRCAPRNTHKPPATPTAATTTPTDTRVRDVMLRQPQAVVCQR